MNWNELVENMRDGNTNTTRFIPKVYHADDIGPLLVAIASAEGGRIFVGVDLMNYHLVGSNLSEKWLHNLIQIYCKPSVSIKIDLITKSEKVVTCIQVEPNLQKNCTYRGKLYVMEDSACRLAKQEEIVAKKALNKDLYQEEDHTETTEETTDEETLNAYPIENETETAKPTFPNSETVPPINDRQSEILEYLESESSIKNKIYRELFSISHKTAHIELTDLVSRGLLQVQGAGRSTAYLKVN